MILIQLLSLAVSSADICEMPSFDPDVDGGKPFCIVEDAMGIETPYFTITVTPRVLVWLYDDGRTLSIESSVHQSQISLSVQVTVVSPNEVPDTMARYGCPDVLIHLAVKVLCDRTEGDYVNRSYVILSDTNLISIGLSAGPLARHELQNYEAIINSIAAAP